MNRADMTYDILLVGAAAQIQGIRHHLGKGELAEAVRVIENIHIQLGELENCLSGDLNPPKPLREVGA